MAVNREEVLKIAELAKLYFSAEGLDGFIVQFQRILDYVAQIKEVNLDDVEPTSHVSLTPDFDRYMFREDEVKPSLTVDESLANAPDASSGYFCVPKVI